MKMSIDTAYLVIYKTKTEILSDLIVVDSSLTALEIFKLNHQKDINTKNYLIVSIRKVNEEISKSEIREILQETKNNIF